MAKLRLGALEAGVGIYINGELLHGMLHPEQLFPLIRRKLAEYINGYVATEELADMEHYVVPASLRDDQGIMGCLELSRRALYQ